MTNIITFAPKATTSPVGAAGTKAAAAAEVVTTDVGAKYAATADLDLAAVAKLVRADIKAAIKVGQLPAGKYAVTIHRYSMGQSLNVRAMVPGMVVRCPIRAAAEAAGDMAVRSLFTAEATAVREELESIMAAYNRREDHAQSDYHHNKFFAFARVD